MVYVIREKKKSFGAGGAQGGEWLYLPQPGGDRHSPESKNGNIPLAQDASRYRRNMEAIVERVGGHGGAQMYRKETVLHHVGEKRPPGVYRA
ncbi:hypothetical protein [Imbroritus primus]|uniref:hypothetical protein n=1 Tax=Imbroritus primus TaxID=3058603 RepID=UPI003D16217B